MDTRAGFLLEFQASFSFSLYHGSYSTVTFTLSHVTLCHRCMYLVGRMWDPEMSLSLLRPHKACYIVLATERVEGPYYLPHAFLKGYREKGSHL